MAELKVHRGFLDEKPDPVSGGAQPRIEDDPLIELARIVSESAANLGRLGVPTSDDPTLLLNRTAQPGPAAPARPVLPASFEDDLITELRGGFDAGRQKPLSPAAAPLPRVGMAAPAVAPAPTRSPDVPALSLPLRGPAAPKPPVAANLDNAFDDLFGDDLPTAAVAKPEPAPAPAASAAKPAPTMVPPPQMQPVPAAASRPTMTPAPAVRSADTPRTAEVAPRPAPVAAPQVDARSRRAAPQPVAQKISRQAVSRPPQSSSRGLLLAGSMLAVVIVGGLGFLGWRAYSTPPEPLLPPVVKADPKPVKVKADPQVAAVALPTDAAAKLSADRVEGDPKLTTKQEDPVDQVGPTGIRKIVPGGPGVSAPAIEGDQPRQVRTVVVRPDGTVQQVAPAPTAIAPKPAPAPAAVAAPAPAPAAVPPVAVATAAPPPVVTEPPPVAAASPVPKPTDAQAGIAAKSAIPQNNGAAVPPKLATPAKPAAAPVPAAQAKAQGQVGAPMALAPTDQPVAAPAAQARVALAPQPVPPPVPAPVPAPAAVGSTGGDFMVQLSAQRSAEDARKSFAAAQSKFGVLAGKSLDIQQANLGTRGTFYRVRVAGGSQDQAANLCSQIKSAGGDCVVTRR